MSDPLPAVVVLDRNDPNALIIYPSHLIVKFDSALASEKGYPSSAIRIVKKLGASQAVVMQGRWVRKGDGVGEYEVLREQRPVALKFSGKGKEMTEEYGYASKAFDILTGKGLAACKYYGIHPPGETTIEIGKGQETGLRDGEGEVMKVGAECEGLQYLLLSDCHLDIMAVLRDQPIKLFGQLLLSALTSLTTLHRANLRHRDIKPANLCVVGMFNPDVDENECVAGKEVVFIDWAEGGKLLFADRQPKGTSAYLSPQTFLLWVRGLIQEAKQTPGGGLPDWEPEDFKDWDVKMTLATLGKGHDADNDINGLGLTFLRIILDVYGDPTRKRDWPISDNNIETIRYALREGKGPRNVQLACQKVFQSQYSKVYGDTQIWTTRLHIPPACRFKPILLKILYIPKSVQTSMESLTDLRIFQDGCWDLPLLHKPELPLKDLEDLIPTLFSKKYASRAERRVGTAPSTFSASDFTNSSYGISTRSRSSKALSVSLEGDVDAPESEQAVGPEPASGTSVVLEPEEKEEASGEDGGDEDATKNTQTAPEYSWVTSLPVVCRSNGNAIITRPGDRGRIIEHWATQESPESNIAVYHHEAGYEKHKKGVLKTFACGVKGCSARGSGPPKFYPKLDKLRKHLNVCLTDGPRLTLQARPSPADVTDEDVATWKSKKNM